MQDSLTKKEREENIEFLKKELDRCDQKFYNFFKDDLDYQENCLRKYHGD